MTNIISRNGLSQFGSKYSLKNRRFLGTIYAKQYNEVKKYREISGNKFEIRELVLKIEKK